MVKLITSHRFHFFTHILRYISSVLSKHTKKKQTNKKKALHIKRFLLSYTYFRALKLSAT